MNGTKIKKNSQMANWALINCKKNILTKLRILNRGELWLDLESAHMLAIETGRYKGIPWHDRICTRCTDNTVEDERHFLFSCNYHTQEKEALILSPLSMKIVKTFHYLI